MKEKRIGPGQILFTEKEILNKLYFIMNGDVELHLNFDSNIKTNSSTLIELISKGGLLGEIPFFTD